MSILDSRPELRREIEKVSEVAGYLWEKGWAERNGGNIVVNVSEYIDDELKSLPAIAPVVPMAQELPNLKGCWFSAREPTGGCETWPDSLWRTDR